MTEANTRLRSADGYIVAEWYGATRHPVSGAPTLHLQTPGGIARYRLSEACARNIVEAGEEIWLQPMRNRPQAESSFGTPQVDGSRPDAGQNVCPPTKSSSAASGEWYEPSNSPSSEISQRPHFGLISKTPQRLSYLQKIMGFFHNRRAKWPSMARPDSGVKASSVDRTVPSEQLVECDDGLCWRRLTIERVAVCNRNDGDKLLQALVGGTLIFERALKRDEAAHLARLLKSD